MAEQIMWRFRLGMEFEIGARAHNRSSVVFGYPNSDHVLFNVFPVVNVCVEASSNDVHPAVIRGNVQNDIGVIAGELRKLRPQHCRRGKPRHQQTHAAGRLVAGAGYLLQHLIYISERRA
jgi:hypothetical protein